MSSKARKPLVLSLVFIGALLIFSILTNKVNEDLTTTMAEATLPVMYFVYQEREMNELHGYVEEMDMLSMRDSLIPMDENRALQMEIMTYGNGVETLSYKIRSMDGERLLIEDNDADILASENKVECNIVLPGILEENVEYNMEICLKLEEREVYYYTRILQPKNNSAAETLDFAYTFHDYTFRDDAVDFIPTYMDAATGDATTLSYVDLSCTLKQITWADFQGQKLTEPVASFKEINSSYHVILLNYVMMNVNENQEVEYYNVEEYYRLRQTPTRMYVLNFERTMNQIFQYENDFLVGNSAILLGIRDADVEYLSDESGDCIAFVQEGDLWCYDRVNHTISQVFSFRSGEGINQRENWKQHDIRIIHVDEAGSVSFLVYGYMNRGEHEGKVGVGVYYYDGISHTVEEELFISSNKSYEVLQAEIGQLMYVNEQKILHLTLNDAIYRIDMNTLEVSTLLSGGSEEAYAVSPSGRYLAWVSPENINSSTCIVLEDLKNETTYQIQAEAGTYIKPLAFVGEDFIYGVAYAEDVRYDVVGHQVFLMHNLQILNTSEDKTEIIKTYTSENGYIGEISVDEKNIYVKKVGESNGHFVQIGSDTIMNRDTEISSGVTLKKSVTDGKQTQMLLSIKEISDKKAVKIIVPKQILLEEARTIAIEQETENRYYVYAKGNVCLSTQDVSKAVQLANEKNGVVVDSKLQYIFKRARDNSQTPISNLTVHESDKNQDSSTKCLSAILMYENAGISVSELMQNGQSALEILSNTLNNAKVLELQDCSMDELLYFINQGTLVYAKVGADEVVLLTGYNSGLVYYYDTQKGQTQSASYEQIENMFFNGGNYFLVYVK